MDQTASLPENKGPPLGYLSRTTASFYRTLLAPTSPEQRHSDKTLQFFVFIFNSSTVCRVTLKDKLRQILLKGAFATRTTSTPTTPSSVVQRDLFDQDITAPVLRELSLQFFSSFESITQAAASAPPNLNELRDRYDVCTILNFDLVPNP